VDVIRHDYELVQFNVGPQRSGGQPFLRDHVPEARGHDAGVDRLLGDAGIVRNGKKIVGTIENAREIKAIAKEHGGMTPWIRSYGRDVGTLIKDTKKRFHHMGDTTSRLFLSCAGALEYPTWKATERQRRGVRD